MPLNFPNLHASPYYQHLCRPNFGQDFFPVPHSALFARFSNSPNSVDLCISQEEQQYLFCWGFWQLLDKSYREGNGTPLQYSCPENPMGGGAWWATDHGVAKSWTRLSDFTSMHWRRKWQPTPVCFPGESQGRGSLVGCRLWGRIESDTTEATQQQQQTSHMQC